MKIQFSVGKWTVTAQAFHRFQTGVWVGRPDYTCDLGEVGIAFIPGQWRWGLRAMFPTAWSNEENISY